MKTVPSTNLRKTSTYYVTMEPPTYHRCLVSQIMPNDPSSIDTTHLPSQLENTSAMRKITPP